MRSSFRARLVNDPFSDPGLFIAFLFERRAIMFDLGDLGPLSPRDLLKVTHVFVTHTHMDHFIGFDTLLRVSLGREKEIHLFGPPGFFRQVEGKLSGYTWNLVDDYHYELVLRVSEVHPAKVITRVYPCRDRFKPKGKDQVLPFSGSLVKEPRFKVEASFLDHRIHCLGLSMVENFYINIDKEKLKARGLPVGPWLTRFKKALYEKRNPKEKFYVTWEEGGEVVKRKGFVLGDLAESITRISPGRKITYITDVVGSAENYEKVISLARDADHLFIEAAFLDRDRDTAKRKYHLTAKEAGWLAKEAGVKRFTVFHFSPRYNGLAHEIEKEAMDAFSR